MTEADSPDTLCSPQVLGEAMTGISQNAKNGNLPEFGEAIATASKALCGFTEAAAQVIPMAPGMPLLSSPPPHSCTRCVYQTDFIATGSLSFLE